MSKALPQPKFYLIGVEDISFPVSPKNYDDTILVFSYGLSIEKWIEQHTDFYKQKLQNPIANVIYTYQDFAQLTNDQRAVFKKIIKQITLAIRIQQIKLQKDFEIKFPSDKGIKHDFTNEATQVYFINKKDVEHLINELYK